MNIVKGIQDFSSSDDLTFAGPSNASEGDSGSLVTLGLLDYDKNHNHDYFGQYCNHDYLK